MISHPFYPRALRTLSGVQALPFLGFTCALIPVVTARVGATELPHAVPATYYVDQQEGNDSNPGTDRRPFRTVQRGIGRANPGDGVHIRQGRYDLSGFSRSIHGALTLTGDGKSATILQNGGTLTIHKGLTLRNLKFTGYRDRILALKEGATIDGLVIDHCAFDGIRYPLIKNSKVSSTVIRNVHLANCHFSNCSGSLFILRGGKSISDVKVTNNIYENLSSDGGLTAVQIGGNATVWSTKDVEITGNYFYAIVADTGNTGREVHAILAYGENMQISYNAVIRMTPGTDHEAIYMKGRYSTITHNVAIDCTSHQGAIAIKGKGKSHHNVIAHNKILSVQGGRALYTAGVESVTMKNNFVKAPRARAGAFIYDASGTACFIVGNYLEVEGASAYLRNSQNGEISANTLVSYTGKTVARSENTIGTRVSGNVERKGRPPRSPVAKATADTLEGRAPLTVRFSSEGSRGSDGAIVSYAWDLHDGASSTDPNPSHTFTAERVYCVTLIVSDAKGLKDLAYVTVRVKPPRHAEFTRPAEPHEFRA